MSVRLRQATLLILLAVLAAVGVKTLGSGTPPRIVAGLALALVLPWVAATRLSPFRASDREGGRASGAGAMVIAIAILLGLLLSTSAAGIATDGLVAGMLIATITIAVIGVPAERPLLRTAVPGRTVLGLAMTAIAIAIAVAAFAIARDRALTQAREESAYAAFLVPDGPRLDVGLTNPKGESALFKVRNAGNGRKATVTVPAKRTRIVPGFVAKPPPLRLRQRLAPSTIRPVKIEVTVFVDGHRRGPVLQLSTYAP